MVARPRPAVLGRAVHLAQAADADGLAQVDVACYGGGAGVEPVRRGGGLVRGWGKGMSGDGKEGRTSRLIGEGVLSRGTF